MADSPPVTHPSSIDIREIREISEMRAVEELQSEVWGCSDREIFPSIALRPMVEVGGVLLGAFDRREMVGFVFGFPGIEAGRPTLHSDMLAVKPQYRSQRLGYKLKLAQRECALAKGIDRITWTFDPLQSLNAYLNFAKLGVVADRYKIDYYGNTSSVLHKTGTDRLWVTWFLESERVRKRILSEPKTKEVPPDVGGLPSLLRVSESNEPLSADTLLNERCLIEIPAEIDTLVQSDVDLATRWREATRRVFTRALDAGYVVEEFYRVEKSGRNAGGYLLLSDEACTALAR